MVDSVPWTAEAEEVLCDDPPASRLQQQQEGEEASTIRPVRKPKPRPDIGLGFRPAPAIERETLSESNLPNLHSSLPTLPPRQRRDSRESQLSHNQPTRRSTMASTRVSPSTSQPRLSLRQRLSSVNNDLFRHGRGESSHSAYPNPPLSPTLTSGFQIGLSAVSPGFAIMPVERRSKHVPQRRRTVSEGDVVRAFAEAERQDREAGGEGGISRRDEAEERENGSAQSRPSWTRFFRGMALFKRHD